MRNVDFRTITRARTNEERVRRHIYGDTGATFSKGKYMVLGGYDVSGCVTTLPSKDCLCAVVYEAKCKPVVCDTVAVQVGAFGAARRSRNHWGNGFEQILEIGEEVSNSLTSNIEHHLAVILYEK